MDLTHFFKKFSRSSHNSYKKVLLTTDSEFHVQWCLQYDDIKLMYITDKKSLEHIKVVALNNR